MSKKKNRGASRRAPNNSDRRRDDRSSRGTRTSRDGYRSDDMRGIDRPAASDSDARNDISWYSKNPLLLAAASAFPYPNRPGMLVNLGNINTTQGVAGDLIYTEIPGVMALEWAPTIGKSQQSTDPASVAAKQIYAKVRAAYSGSLDADAPDFMMYLLSLDSVFSFIAALKRVYRTVNAYSPDNYVTPDGLLVAMGVPESQISNLRNQKMKLWQGINTLVLQSRKFTCPAIMDIFNRHYWMNDNVYSDSPSANSQFYLFHQFWFLRYAEQTVADEGATQKASGCAYTSWPDSTLGSLDYVDTLLAFGNQLIDDLVAWDESYTINGYLLRAYDGYPNFTVAELAIDETLTPVYSEEVLTQIENSRAIDYQITFANNPISQRVSDNSVIWNNTFNLSTGQMTDRRVQLKATVNIRSDSPTSADTTIATRLLAVVDAVDMPNAGDTSTSITVDAGTEIPIMWRLFTRVKATTGQFGTWAPLRIPTISNVGSTTGNTSWAALQLFTSMEAFDWHPFTWIVATCPDPATGQVKDFDAYAIPVGDVRNLSVVDQTTLLNLHRVCLYSEFNSFGN